MYTSTHQHLVHFLPYDRQVTVPHGTSLLEAARKAQLSLDAPCGGNGTCGKCLVKLHTREGIKTVKACATPVTQVMTVEILSSDETGLQICTETSDLVSGVSLNPWPIPTLPNGYLAACDLGSTTIVVYVLDGSTGSCIGSSSMQNPQTRYSADIIGRIDYALTHGAETLQQLVRDAVSRLLIQASQQAGILVREITHLCLVGNCCMHHLFLGIPTDTLAVIPYAPKISQALILPARDYDLPIHPQGILQTLPNIAGFVGGDTAACLNAVAFDTLDPLTLLLDIGTNGELVLGNKERRLACSTAAGPALEGARISCGMRGTIGAIDHVWVEKGSLCYSVIGETDQKKLKPLGICGSGLMDAVSVFLELNILDDSGKFTPPELWPDASKYSKTDHLDSYIFSDSVRITQKDIREIQLAKAAIAAGIELMCEHYGVSSNEIEQVLIAGAFGNHLDPSSACRIGLLPSRLLERIVPIGNAAGTGACRCVCSCEEFDRTKKLVSETEFLELASLDTFQDTFIDQLYF